MAAQDMPPPGGFGSIPIERTFPKPLMRQGIFMFTIIAASLNGFFYLKEWKKRYRILRVEEQEHYIAMSPFLWAEQDRKYLKRLNTLRRDEEMLMKDVPGWSTGTLFGEKIYKTVPNDQLTSLTIAEYTLGRPKLEWRWNAVVPDFWK